MTNRFRNVLPAVCLLLYCASLSPSACAQSAPILSKEAIAANRELDRRLLEAHDLKDAAMVERAFSSSPDVFFITPGGVLVKGGRQIRQSFEDWFKSLRSVHGEIQEISYLPAGDGVIGLGKVIYSRQEKDGSRDTKLVIWTDFRRVEGGRWVYLFRHAHWPVGVNNRAGLSK